MRLCWCAHAGKPVFGTLIALLRNGEPIIGVIDQPITKERWVGVKGQGTTLNSQSLSPSRVCFAILCKTMFYNSVHAIACLLQQCIVVPDVVFFQVKSMYVTA